MTYIVHSSGGSGDLDHPEENPSLLFKPFSETLGFPEISHLVYSTVLKIFSRVMGCSIDHLYMRGL